MLIGLAVATVFALGACSKYKGFKKDKSGFYYQFHGDIHDTADQPATGDLVGILMSRRRLAVDSYDTSGDADGLPL